MIFHILQNHSTSFKSILCISCKGQTLHPTLSTLETEFLWAHVWQNKCVTKKTFSHIIGIKDRFQERIKINAFQTFTFILAVNLNWHNEELLFLSLIFFYYSYISLKCISGSWRARCHLCCSGMLQVYDSIKTSTPAWFKLQYFKFKRSLFKLFF